MANKTTPFTLDLDVDLIEVLECFKKRINSPSVSAIIRVALEEFDFEAFKSSVPERRQISVRLTKGIRDELKRTAKDRGVSIGNIVREALISSLKQEKKDPREQIVDTEEITTKPTITQFDQSIKGTDPWQI